MRLCHFPGVVLCGVSRKQATLPSWPYLCVCRTALTGSPCQDPLTLLWAPASLQPPSTAQAWPREVWCLVAWGGPRGRSP